MIVSEYIVAIFVGLCISLFVEIKLGIAPGGLIVPSYIALVLDRPAVVINIFAVSIISFLIIKYLLSRFMLIYGKRRFIACVLISLLIKIVLGFLFPVIPFSILAFEGIGVVTSGIMANTYFKQGIVLTAGACLIVSGIVFLIINVMYLI